MMSIQRASIACLTLGLLVLCTSSCGGKEEPAATREKPEAQSTSQKEKAPEAAKSATGEQGEIRYSGETTDGNAFTAQIGGEVALPSSLPSDLPLYPNAVPYAALEVNETATVSFESWDPASDVYKFYSQKLPESGWNIDNEVDMGARKVISASKGGQEAELTIETTDDGSRISFIVQSAG